MDCCRLHTLIQFLNFDILLLIVEDIHWISLCCNVRDLACGQYHGRLTYDFCEEILHPMVGSPF